MQSAQRLVARMAVTAGRIASGHDAAVARPDTIEDAFADADARPAVLDEGLARVDEDIGTEALDLERLDRTRLDFAQRGPVGEEQRRRIRQENRREAPIAQGPRGPARQTAAAADDGRQPLRRRIAAVIEQNIAAPDHGRQRAGGHGVGDGELARTGAIAQMESARAWRRFDIEEERRVARSDAGAAIVHRHVDAITRDTFTDDVETPSGDAGARLQRIEEEAGDAARPIEHHTHAPERSNP